MIAAIVTDEHIASSIIMPKMAGQNTGWIPAQSFRRWLEVASTVAVLVAAVAMTWTVWKQPSAPPGRPPVEVPDKLVDVAHAARLGNDAATVALVEFSDFECPYCAQFTRETLPAIKERYIDTGLVRLVFIHLPLTIHQHAQAAAEAAACAQRQGHFWEMHDRLFVSAERLRQQDLRNYAEEIGLDLPAFEQCGNTGSPIELDIELATDLGITATPTFLVGRIRADGAVETVEVIEGAVPLERFVDAIEPLR